MRPRILVVLFVCISIKENLYYVSQKRVKKKTPQKAIKHTNTKKDYTKMVKKMIKMQKIDNKNDKYKQKNTQSSQKSDK